MKTTEFPKPPVVEAVVDIRFRPGRETSVQEIEQLCASLGDRYPRRSPRQAFAAGLQLSPGRVALGEARHDVVGCVAWNDATARAVQLGMGIFSFHKFRPYEGWEAFCEEALALWSWAAEELRPTTIERIGVRYINSLTVPSPVGDLGRYLRTFPRIGDELPQVMSTFFMRAVLPDEQTGCIAVLTLGLDEPTVSIDTVSLFLDIDVYRQGPVEADLDVVRRELVPLRELRSRAFFGSITEEMRRLFS